MKLIIILLCTLNLYSQVILDQRFGVRSGGFGGSGSSGQRFSAVDLDGSTEYMYRNYAVADSFLNLNGYERTQLPQSTMKVPFSGVAYTQAFGNVDTAVARDSWVAFSSTYTQVVNGKLRFETTGANSGIRKLSFLTIGSVYQVKFKARYVSGTLSQLFIGSGVGTTDRFLITTLSTEEITFEGTFLALSTGIYFGQTGASAQIVEIDDIEVREISNSVTNGTFASGSTTGWTLVGITGVTSGLYYGDTLDLRFAAFTGTGSVQTYFMKRGARYSATFQVIGNTANLAIRNRTIDTGYVTSSNYAVGVHTVNFIASATSLSFVFSTASAGACTLTNIHIYEVPSYQGVGNHSVGWSKVDALPNTASDTTSLRIISTAKGDSLNNNVYIVSGANTYHSTQSTNKYTLEVWARSKGKRGTPTYTMDGTASTGWSTIKGTLTANLTISDGGTLFDSVYSFYGNHESTEHYFSRSPLTSGVTYRISYWYLIPSSNDTVNAMYQIHSGASIYEGNARLLTTTGVWTYVSTMFKASTTGLSFYLSQNSNTTITAVNDTIYIANLQIVPITQTNLHLHVQGQTKISDTLSVIPGQFEKVVFNFEANSSVTDSIRIYLSQSDTLWVDSLNLSQSYDQIFEGWKFKRNATRTEMIFHRARSFTGVDRGYFLYNISGVPFFYIGDSAGADNNMASSVNPSAFQWYYMQVVVKHDSVLMFINGVRTAAMLRTKGNLNNRTAGLYIGASNAGTAPFDGLRGEFRITRFDNIGSSTWNYGTPLATYNAYTRGAGFQDNITGGGKKIVVWYDFGGSTTAEMMQDLSGNGYKLDNYPNILQSEDQVFWKR